MTDHYKNRISRLYSSLPEEGKYVADLINRNHAYFSRKDKQLKIIVKSLRFSVLFFAMLSTIALGLSNILEEHIQRNLGLIFSSAITLLTGLIIFLNIEKYWMRNISKHIELNKIRDKFYFDVSSNLINEEKYKEYMKDLEKLQTSNIKYWKKAIKNS